jgi:hypothetical protein
MSNKKIVDGSAIGSISGTTELEVSDGGVTQLKGTASQIGDYVGTSKTYSSLNTTAKEIDSAINEVDSESVKLTGTSGGQDIIGGTASNDGLTFEPTSNATKGYFYFKPSSGLGIGEAPSTYTAFSNSQLIVAGSTNVVSAVIRSPVDGSGRLIFTESATSSTNQGYINFNHTANLLSFYVNGATRFVISNTGVIQAVATYNNPIGGRSAYVDSSGNFGYFSSSIKHKLNIENIENTDWIYNIRTVNFEYKKKDGDNKFIEKADGVKRSGIIAEELDLIKPEFVYKSDNGKSIDGVDYDQLIPVLVDVVQKQKKMIDALEVRIIALEV